MTARTKTGRCALCLSSAETLGELDRCPLCEAAVTKHGELSGLLHRELEVRQMSQQALADAVGVSRVTIYRYLNGGEPNVDQYSRLRSYFGTRLPRCNTDTPRRRRQAQRNAKALNNASAAVQSERGRVGGRANLGSRHPKQAESMRQAYADGRRSVPVAGVLQLVADSKTPERRAGISLGRYLWRTPQPPSGLVERWAFDVGSRLSVSPKTIRDWWQPTLAARGILMEGRPPGEERCTLVEPTMAKWPRRPDGRFEGGIWEEIAKLVRENEYKPGYTAGSARSWWTQHKCRRHPDDNVSRRRARQQRAALERGGRDAQLGRAVEEGRFEELPAIMTPGQVCSVLGVSRSTVTRLRQAGELTAIEEAAGGWHRYKRENVVNFLGSRDRTAASAAA
jgi:excisionase family DNA binding protein